ncbi:MOP flippase family protein [Coleofasciculus sp. F4-SAH-05]|uniref:MOP flippase family protein n=1 Tax=Coleofasciculus sp. F4-SAH-05 TaxID=3069525 RepID=UPI0032F2F210
MNLRQKAVKGVVWSAIQGWGTQAIAFIVFFVLARLLEPEAFGLVALAGVFLAFIQIFIDQGLSTAIVQRQELEPEHLDSAFWTNLGISLLLTLFGIAAAGFVAELFKEPQLAPILRWLSLSFLFIGLNGVQQAIFERQLAFKALAIRSMVAVVAGGVVGVVMAFLDFGVWSLVGKQLVNGVVEVIVLWGASNWRPGFKVSIKHFRELFSFGINLVGLNILGFLNRRLDDFLIGYYLGPLALGYYSISYKLLLIMTNLLTSVTTKVALPTFSRLKQEPEKLRRAFYTVTQLTSLISFPTFMGMAALASELIPGLFGEKWLPSIPVMQILAFIGIIHSVAYFNGSVMMSMGKPSWQLKLNCMHTIANVVLFFVAVRWGIEAVAAVYVIRSYLLTPVDLLVIRKLINIKLTTYVYQYIVPFTGTLGMVAAILIAKYLLANFINLYTLIVVCSLLGTAMYTLIITLIAPKLIHKVMNLIKLTFSV